MQSTMWKVIFSRRPVACEHWIFYVCGLVLQLLKDFCEIYYSLEYSSSRQSQSFFLHLKLATFLHM